MTESARREGAGDGDVTTGEFALIERYFRRPPIRGDVILGIGDDAAVLTVPAGRSLVACTDTLTGGIHFPADTAPFAIGHKALAVNLSDLAAMGAQPHWATVAITAPSANSEWFGAFSDGMRKIADRYQVDIVGGDTTRGPLSVTVQALGTVAGNGFLRRGGARPDDILFVTGTLGDAAVGLLEALGDIELDRPSHLHCRSSLDLPEPRVEAGLKLAGFATAAIDLSDGLVADMGHILKDSGGLGADIDLDALPLSAPVRAIVDTGQQGTDWTLPLAGGDDYELLFTVRPQAGDEVKTRLGDIGHRVTRIGRIVSRPGIRFREGEFERQVPGLAGYEHFR